MQGNERRFVSPIAKPGPHAASKFLPGGQIFLIPAGYYALHILEELPGFAEWVTRNFTAKSELTFAIFEILTLAFVVVVSYKALNKGAHGGWVVLAVAAQIQFFLNALFHLGTAIAFQEYSPGMVTAGALALLLTPYFIARVWREGRVTAQEMTIAAGLGVVIAAGAIGALFI